MNRAPARPYANAGTIGVALGVLLFVSYVVAGRGLGASGAFASAAGSALSRFAPSALTSDPSLADRIPSPAPLAENWILLEIIGVFIGGALSAWLAGRWHERHDALSPTRTMRAGVGGGLMGLGARLAYGCTSGLALSGGALLSTGAWTFIPVTFGTAILVTMLARGRGDGSML